MRSPDELKPLCQISEKTTASSTDESTRSDIHSERHSLGVTARKLACRVHLNPQLQIAVFGSVHLESLTGKCHLHPRTKLRRLVRNQGNANSTTHSHCNARGGGSRSPVEVSFALFCSCWSAQCHAGTTHHRNQHKRNADVDDLHPSRSQIAKRGHQAPIDAAVQQSPCHSDCGKPSPCRFSVQRAARILLRGTMGRTHHAEPIVWPHVRRLLAGQRPESPALPSHVLLCLESFKHSPLLSVSHRAVSERYGTRFT